MFAKIFFEGKHNKFKMFNDANGITEISTLNKAIRGERSTPKAFVEEVGKLNMKVKSGTKLTPVGITQSFFHVDALKKVFCYVMGQEPDIAEKSRDMMFCTLLLEAANESCVSAEAFDKREKLTDAEYNKILEEIENTPIPEEYTKKAVPAPTEAPSAAEAVPEPVPEPPAAEPEDLFAEFRKLAEKYFKAIKKVGRFGQYFPTKQDGKFISDITVTLKTSNQEALRFEHVLFPPEELPEDCKFSVSLSGKGGIGKSFLFLHLIETIFDNENERYSNVIPLYIELQKVNNDYGCDIRQALINELKRVDHDLTEERFSEYMKAAGSKVIVFADGMNEVVGIEKRGNIANSITDTASDYNCRFCISSRENHAGMFNNLARINGYFRASEVNKLTPKQIKDYLHKHTSDVQYSDLHSGTRKLLETPQGLEMFVSLVGSDRSNANRFTSLGELILAYSDSILGISSYRGDPNYDFSFEETLEEIAYNWVKDSVFECKLTQDQREKIRFLRNNQNLNLEAIFPCTYGSYYDIEATFTFSHQNFRDCYCARFIARKIKCLNSENISRTFSDFFNPSTSTVTNNDDILELVSAFTSSGPNEYDKKAIDTLRQASKDEKAPLQNYDYPLNVLIKIFALRKDNCIAELDFTDLDLREVSLNGYYLFNKKTGDSTIFYNTKLNVNTFLKNGLDTAARTITKFRYKGKEYIAAFASTSALIIDIAESQARIVRGLSNHGKVNCCCVTSKNGLPLIYLGQGSSADPSTKNEPDKINGVLSEFYPHILFMHENEDEAFVPQKYVKQNLLGDIGSVESICTGKLGSEEYIFYATGNGKLGMIKNYQVGNHLNSFILLDDNDNMLWSQKRCCLTYSVKNNMLFVGWKKGLYFIDCSKPITVSAAEKKYINMRNSPPAPDILPVCYVGEDDTEVIDYDIEDIFACDNFLFVNLVYKIAVFKILDTSGHIVFCDFIYPAGKDNDSIKFTRFSECHVTNGFASVLVGVNADRYRPSKNTSDRQIKRFYQIFYSEDEEQPDRFTKGLGNDYDGFATWTGVFYTLSDKTFLASVSSRRTVEIDCISDEEIPKRTYAGAYNGVHYIDINGGDQKKKRIICGNYDGNVVCLKSSVRYNGSQAHEVWKVENVFHLHENWVWKCVFLSETQILSCGYDGKLWLTDIQSEKRICLLNEEGEQFLDFCIDRCTDTIWVISKNKVFCVKKTGDEWDQKTQTTIDSFKNLNTEKICFRTIAIDQLSTDDAKKEDTPILFYNDGKGGEGHIVMINAPRKMDFLDLTSYNNNKIYSVDNPYIRHMRFHSFNGKRRLIGVGNVGKCSLFFIAKYAGDNEQIVGRMVIESIETSQFGEINDFTVTESEKGYVLWLAHKDFTVSAYRLFDSPRNLGIKNYDKPSAVKMPDQPMCLRACGSYVLIGLLNGEVIKASISTFQKNYTEYATISTENVARTYADLMANTSVKLKNCKYDEEEEEFSSMMQNYFIMEQD